MTRADSRNTGAVPPDAAVSATPALPSLPMSAPRSFSSASDAPHAAAPALPSSLSLSPTAAALLLLGFAALWFVQLGIRHLVPTDEGRYAEMAREMFVTHDWITPRYNGYKYFEKPPLQTWFNALSFAWFGIGDWQARLYTALTGFAGVLLAGFTGARVFGRQAGLCAALVLASAPYWNLMGHFNALDMGLSFWMEATLCALLLAQRPGLPERAARGWMWACWASMALAILSKGLIGVLLPGAVLVLYTLIQRDWALWKRLYIGSGLLVFAAVVLPWFILVQIRNPEFFDFFFVVQQFRRYLTPEQNRPGPFYYFVPVLLLGFLPWLAALPRSLRDAASRLPQANGFAPLRLLLIWAVFIFAFFSASHSKLMSYILPTAPAFALLLGCTLPQLDRKALRRLFGVSAALLLVTATAAVLLRFNDAIGQLWLHRLNSDRTPLALYLDYLPWLAGALALGGVGSAAALWLVRRNALQALIAFAASWFVLISIGGNAHEIFGRYASGALLVPAVDRALDALPPAARATAPFYMVGAIDHTLPFYLRRTMIIVQNPDELAFGTQMEPWKWLPTYAAWEARWRTDRYAFALLGPDLYARFAAAGVPMQVIARDGRRVIVEKPPAP